MRRLWVVAGLLGVVVSFVAGFVVGDFQLWPLDANWTEAAGTWVSAALSAAILGVLTVRSERFTRRLEAARQANQLEAMRQAGERDLEAMRQARDEDEARRREEVKANSVICNAWPTDQRTEDDGTRVAGAIVVTLTNHTGGVLGDVGCTVPFGGIGSVHLSDAVAPGKDVGPTSLTGPEPIRLSANDNEVRGNVAFTFLLGDQWWSRCPADPQAFRMSCRLP